MHRDLRLTSLVLLIATLFTTAQVRAQCDDWRTGPIQNSQAFNGADATVYALTTWDPDGAGPLPARLVAGGNFTRMQDTTVSRVAVLDPATGAWESPGDPAASPFQAEVRCLTSFDNQLIAGAGSLVSAGDRAFRWDGSAWHSLDRDYCMPTFYNMTPLYVRSLASYHNTLYLGGNYTVWWNDTSDCHGQFTWGATTWDGAAHCVLPPTSLPVSSDILAMTQFGSNLIFAGTFNFGQCSCEPGNYIASWNGTDFVPMPGTDDQVMSLAIFNGDLIAGGTFNLAGGVAASSIARWDGTAWHALGTGLNGAVTSLRVFQNNLIAGGTFTQAGALVVNHIARWDGSSWHAMSSGVNSAVDALTVFNNDLVVGGDFTAAGSITANRIARWDGVQWSSFGGGTVSAVNAITQFGFGAPRLIAAGSFQQSSNITQPANNIVAWDGLVLSTLGTGMNAPIHALKTFTTGIGISQTVHLVAGGEFTSAGGASAVRIADWAESNVGVPPPAWSPLGPGLNNTVLAIERFNSSTVAAGAFTATGNNATTLNHIAQWNGTTWSQLGTGLNGSCYALKVYNGALYAGGVFTTANGTVNTGGLARWNGTTWSAVQAAFSGAVIALEVYNGDLIIGGSFPGIAGSPNIAKYNSVSNSYSTLGTGGADGTVESFVVENGNLYVGGAFTHAGGFLINRLARWDGSAWGDVRGGADSSVYALAAYHNEVHAGGAFANVRNGAVPAPSWARYLETGIPWIVRQPQSVTAACNANVSFSARGAAGYSANYNWRHNSIPLADGPTGTGSIVAGAHNATLDVRHISVADEGAYDLVLSNNCGSITTNTATLTRSGGTGDGDGNGDGLTDGQDISGMSATLITGDLQGRGLCAYDMNGDGQVNAADLPLFAARLLGS